MTAQGRDLPSAFTNAAAAAVAYPIYVVDIYKVDSPAQIVRVTSADRDVVFPDGGDTYESVPLKHDEQEVDVEGGGELTLVIADIDGLALDSNKTFRSMIKTDGVDFYFNRVTIYKIERNVKDSVDKSQRDDYFVWDLDFAPGVVMFILRPRSAIFDVIDTGDTVTQSEFPGVPAAER